MVSKKVINEQRADNRREEKLSTAARSILDGPGIRGQPGRPRAVPGARPPGRPPAAAYPRGRQSSSSQVSMAPMFFSGMSPRGSQMNSSLISS